MAQLALPIKADPVITYLKDLRVSPIVLGLVLVAALTVFVVVEMVFWRKRWSPRGKVRPRDLLVLAYLRGSPSIASSRAGRRAQASPSPWSSRRRGHTSPSSRGTRSGSQRPSWKSK